MNKKAFTLIELIIVIATISILAAFAFVAVDPGKRIGEANDSERLSEARSLEEAIGKYSIDNLLLPPTITYLEDNIPYMITSAFISDSLYCSEIGENISEVVLGTILEASKKLNRKSLKREKYNIVKELREHYNVEDLFKTNISHYKSLAALYTLFEIYNSKEIINPNQIVDNRLVLLEQLTAKEINKNDESYKLD